MDCRICCELLGATEILAATERGGIHVAPTATPWLVQPEKHYRIFLPRGYRNGQPRPEILSASYHRAYPGCPHNRCSSTGCFLRQSAAQLYKSDTSVEGGNCAKQVTTQFLRVQSSSGLLLGENPEATQSRLSMTIIIAILMVLYHPCHSSPCTASKVLCDHTLSPLATCVNVVRSRRVADGWSSGPPRFDHRQTAARCGADSDPGATLRCCHTDSLSK